MIFEIEITCNLANIFHSFRKHSHLQFQFHENEKKERKKVRKIEKDTHSESYRPTGQFTD